MATSSRTWAAWVSRPNESAFGMAGTNGTRKGHEYVNGRMWLDHSLFMI
jgi:hypothetical protein